MKEHYTKTGEKVKHYNVVEPDMKFYRKCTPDDEKQKGDLFNIGKWSRGEDKFVLSSSPNGSHYGAWSMYFLVLKERENSTK